MNLSREIQNYWDYLEQQAKQYDPSAVSRENAVRLQEALRKESDRLGASPCEILEQLQAHNRSLLEVQYGIPSTRHYS